MLYFTHTHTHTKAIHTMTISVLYALALRSLYDGTALLLTIGGMLLIL